MTVQRKGVDSTVGLRLVTRGTSCIQHWNDTGDLPHLDEDSILFLHSVLGFVQFHLCQRPGALTEAEIYVNISVHI